MDCWTPAPVTSHEQELVRCEACFVTCPGQCSYASKIRLEQDATVLLWTSMHARAWLELWTRSCGYAILPGGDGHLVPEAVHNDASWMLWLYTSFVWSYGLQQVT